MMDTLMACTLGITIQARQGTIQKRFFGGMKSVSTKEFLEGMTLTNVAHANPEEVR